MLIGYWDEMDVERIIDEIDQLEEIFESSDIRPLGARDISAANRRHDEELALSPCSGSGSSSQFVAAVGPKAGIGFSPDAVRTVRLPC
jgi:hypothetical protein